MSIVKMKRLRLVGMREDRDAMLRLLQRQGCVEIREPELDLSDPAWAALAKPDSDGLSRAKEESVRLGSALAAVRKYAPSKTGLLDPRPGLRESEFLDDETYKVGLEAARQVLDAEQLLTADRAELGKLQSQKAALTPWLALNVPLDFAGGENFSVQFCSVPNRVDMAAVEEALAQASELCQAIYSGSDRELHYFLLVYHNSALAQCQEALRPLGYAQVNLRGWSGTAAQNLQQLENTLAARERKVAEDLERLSAFGERRRALEMALDRADQEVARGEARGHLIDTQTAFLLDGWFPADQEQNVAALLGRYVCAWETADPTPEEYPEVPVQLKNNVVTRSMNTITEMYSMPAYDGIDPNPLMAPFFILIYGCMMADMTYGLLMVLGAGIYLKKARPKDPYFMEMIFWCGISSFIMGALTGGFFGDFIPTLLRIINPASTFEMPALFTPLSHTVYIMIGSVVLGFIQIITGMAISVWYKTTNGDFLDALFDEITWWIILAGLGVWICASVVGILPAVCGTIGLGMLILGGLMLVFGGTRKEKGFGKVTGLVGIVYNGVTGFFSDALSYVRIMALMLAGSVIASVFNTLGATFGNVILFIIISLFGNALNFALNLLGCYVHDLRLQCLEFFGRFYKEGGKPYRPLSIQTQYVEIIKEEN